MSEQPLEVIVYGDAPEDSPGGGGTDIISTPADFYTYYVPLGPVVVNPPPLGPTGGGGKPPKQRAEDAEGVMVMAGALFAVLTIATEGTAAIILGGLTINSGIMAWNFGEWEEDPPELNYQRPGGSTVRRRTPALPGPPSVDRALEVLLQAEHACAVFVDCIECAQGAFLAADAEWTQRHNEAARDAYLRLGQSLVEVADVLHDQVRNLPVVPSGPPPDVAAELPALLARFRPILDLSPEDETHVTDLLVPAVSRVVPSDAEVKAGIKIIRDLGGNVVNQQMYDTRFAWPVPEGLRKTADGSRR